MIFKTKIVKSKPSGNSESGYIQMTKMDIGKRYVLIPAEYENIIQQIETAMLGVKIDKDDL